MDIDLSMSVLPSVRPYVRPSFRPRSHYQVTPKQNFMKLIPNMYHYNDVMHVKFGLAGLGSS